MLGLDAFGVPVLGDDAPDDFAGSREIVTEFAPAPGGNEHGSTASDGAVPLDENGVPRHARAGPICSSRRSPTTTATVA
ncbi:MAG: hypothetical protein HC882_08160, partial [Acidobacteria bacterium]|nr:hypothetical protein [Acidobacteriota bacterium]